jgi:copper homeostasis protein (lipoprotein)
MKIIFIPMLSLTIMMSQGCKNGSGAEKGKAATEQVSTEMADEHTAQNSLDWSGTYSGVLPCADCEGIATELSLKDDGSFELSEKYLGKEEETERKMKGKFTWDGNKVVLRNEKGRTVIYRVEENRLRAMDTAGNMIEGALSDNYLLAKHGNPEVENRRWQLVELNGKEVKGSAETHYIEFQSSDNTLIVKAGCNMIYNRYKIKNMYRLEVTPGISTLMACEDKTEDELVKVLLQADNITFNENTLAINKARMASLAVFKLVE